MQERRNYLESQREKTKQMEDFYSAESQSSSRSMDKISTDDSINPIGPDTPYNVKTDQFTMEYSSQSSVCTDKKEKEEEKETIQRTQRYHLQKQHSKGANKKKKQEQPVDRSNFVIEVDPHVIKEEPLASTIIHYGDGADKPMVITDQPRTQQHEFSTKTKTPIDQPASFPTITYVISNTEEHSDPSSYKRKNKDSCLDCDTCCSFSCCSSTKDCCGGIKRKNCCSFDCSDDPDGNEKNCCSGFKHICCSCSCDNGENYDGNYGHTLCCGGVNTSDCCCSSDDGESCKGKGCCDSVTDVLSDCCDPIASCFSAVAECFGCILMCPIETMMACLECKCLDDD